MIRLNVSAVTVLSTLFARDYRDRDGAQLINISSAGDIPSSPNAVVYCATKFYVSAFTEGLARELKTSGALLRAKVLAPSVNRTGFGPGRHRGCGIRLRPAVREVPHGGGDGGISDGPL